MSAPLPLLVWDRYKDQFIREFMDDSPQTYESHPKRSFRQWLESHPLYDWILAAYQNSRFSVSRIGPFIQKHDIAIEEFESVRYHSYAEFFERRFRPGSRHFPEAEHVMGAFAEARYFAWARSEAAQNFSIKGRVLNIAELLGDDTCAAPFLGGPVLLARLSPMDYHHLHYPDAGTTLATLRQGGRLWTVNPNALRNQPAILSQNERRISILATKHFGLLGFVEVGALSVGRIVQVHPVEHPYARGEEKSVFRFGGSAVVVFGEPSRWRPSDDLLRNTQKGFETFVRLGDAIAQA